METDTDPLYLVCRECGEAFKADEPDAMELAYTHQAGHEASFEGFDIRPESEAM